MEQTYTLGESNDKNDKMAAAAKVCKEVNQAATLGVSAFVL